MTNAKQNASLPGDYIVSKEAKLNNLLFMTNHNLLNGLPNIPDFQDLGLALWLLPFWKPYGHWSTMAPMKISLLESTYSKQDHQRVMVDPMLLIV